MNKGNMRIANKALLLAVVITAISVAIIAFTESMSRMNENIANIGKKVDAMASSTDATLKLHGVQLENMETNIKQLHEEQNNQTDELQTVTNTVDNLKKQLDKKVKELDEKIEEVRIAKQERRNNYASAPGTMVASATIIKSDHGQITEIEDDSPVDEPMEFWCTCDLTAYIPTGNPCANGNYPTAGYTVACNTLPFGTKIYIEGWGYRVVEDRGGMPGNGVDLFVNTVEEAKQIGRQSVNVYICK